MFISRVIRRRCWRRWLRLGLRLIVILLSVLLVWLLCEVWNLGFLVVAEVVLFEYCLTNVSTVFEFEAADVVVFADECTVSSSTECGCSKELDSACVWCSHDEDFKGSSADSTLWSGSALECDVAEVIVEASKSFSAVVKDRLD